MISYLKGKIKYKADYLIIEVHGVGYKVAVPVNVLDNVKEGEEFEIFTHQHIREDALDLYGFKAINDLNFFQDLISVSGVGPKSALAVIAKFKIDDIKKSIINEDTSLLTKVSGIGKKTAERLIVELKNKINDVSKEGYKPLTTADEEAVDALISLGYNKAQAIQALNRLDKNLSLEEKVRQALKSI